jgi:hypothetical protein
MQRVKLRQARPRESAGTATQTEAVTGAVDVADEVIEPASTDCNAAVGAGTSWGGQNGDEKHAEAETVVNASQGKREDSLAAAQEASGQRNSTECQSVSRLLLISASWGAMCRRYVLRCSSSAEYFRICGA